MKTVAITFDYWPDAFTVASPLMLARGLLGTWFVSPDTIDTSLGIQRDHLTQLKMSGWTIGAYSDDNMVDLFNLDRNAAMDRLASIKAQFRAKGFEVQSLAPNQRAWNERLRNVCVGLFERVRVALLDEPQSLPVEDSLWINKGGVPSLDNGTTSASVNGRIDDFLAGSGELLHFVVHKIGDGTGDFEVPLAAFTALLDRLEAERDAGTIQVIGYDDLGGIA